MADCACCWVRGRAEAGGRHVVEAATKALHATECVTCVATFSFLSMPLASLIRYYFAQGKLKYIYQRSAIKRELQTEQSQQKLIDMKLAA